MLSGVMTRVKICGIRRAEDAALAVRCGADAIGVLVGRRHASTDFVAAELAAEILAGLPPFVSGTLVTHVPEHEEAIVLALRCRPSALQIHSAMPPEGVAEVRRALPGVRIIKCIHVLGPECLGLAAAYEDRVDAFLLDSSNPATGQAGGTGLTHDWRISRRFAEASARPVILAGGLNPGNVREAIQAVAPFAVDVNSGVKGADGFKDAERVKAFVERARMRG